MGQSFLSKETTRWQGLGVKPPNFRSEVQSANYKNINQFSTVSPNSFILTNLGESMPYIFLIFATLAFAWRDLLTGDGLL